MTKPYRVPLVPWPISGNIAPPPSVYLFNENSTNSVTDARMTPNIRNASKKQSAAIGEGVVLGKFIHVVKRHAEPVSGRQE